MKGKKKKKFFKVVGVVAAIVAGFVVLKKMLFPSTESLNASGWKVGNTYYEPGKLSIERVGLGRYKIGDGYVGRYLFGRIVTMERNGASDPKLVWIKS